jgi:hypothetical protein
VVDADRRLHRDFVLLLDVSIVNVALPSIQRGLGASFSDLQCPPTQPRERRPRCGEQVALGADPRSLSAGWMVREGRRQ